MFTRSGSTWTQQGGKLSSSEATGSSEIGFSVALAASGNIALIGAPGDNTSVGAAWVYTRAGSTWTQQGTKILPKSGEETGEARFGDTVALSSEGNTALISGPLNKEGAGAAWVFTSSGSTWTQQGEKLIPKSGEEIGAGEFGSSLALGANGRAALIGAPQDNGNLGAAWMFTRSGATWTQQGTKILPKSGEEIGEGLFGFDVALSSEANTALIGGAGDNNAIGAAWTFANTAPFTETKPASSITQTTATLNGSVNPDGVEVTTCEFEYGTTISYGKTAKCTTGPGSGSSQVAVSAPVTTLTANTTYHYRIIAANSGGATQGQDETFKTTPGPPTVVTKPASEITQTTATLNGTVNPNGAEVTKCEFEYGTTISYGKTVKCAALPGSGESAVAVSAPIAGLTASTAYHFRLIAATAGGEGKGSDETFTTALGAPVVETKPASSITYNTAVLNATVNPEGSNVTTCILEIATAEFYEANHKAYESGEECASLPGSGTSPVPVSALAGVTAKTVYHFRILACNATACAEGADLTFETLPSPPTVETKPASSITKTSATLNATVNANGGEAKCEFEYGTTVSYGTKVACVPSTVTGSSAVAVSASVTGLTAGTTYHFRAVAVNGGGKGEGGDATFTTASALSAPTVVTGTGSSLTASVASVNGTVNPNSGQVTECEFEYGTTVSYGSSVPCRPTPGAGTSAVAVSAPISGLTAGTTYHFRVAAANSAGRSTGSDQTFTTPAAVHAHWYSNGTRVEEGKKEPYVSWGAVSFTGSKGGASTECHAEVTGYVENPRGAAEGAFEGEGAQTIEAFNAYNCVNTECEAEGGSAGVLAEQLPWPASLSEEVKGTFRLASAGVQLFVHCQRSSSAPTEKAGSGSFAGFEERKSSEYNSPGAATCTTNGGGSMKPKVVTGSSTGKPTKIQFTAGAGGELECGAAGKLTTTGNLKIQGFEESELVSVKNP